MIPDFRFARVSFKLEVKETIVLPKFRGSALRGGFGRTFRKIVCVQKGINCDECMLKSTCSYSLLFATPNLYTDTPFSGNDSLPRPYVFEMPGKRHTYWPGDNLGISITLFGWAVGYFPYFFIVMRELGNNGFGSRRNKGERGKFEIVEVKQIKASGEESLYNGGQEEKLPPPEGENLAEVCTATNDSRKEISVEYLTPCRIKFKKTLIDEISFPVLIRNILRRLSLLYLLNTGEQMERDYKGIISRAEEVQTREQKLQWQEYNRFSTRQKGPMKLGGVVGKVVYSGSIEEFYPLLKIAEIIHVGKGTTFGFGKVKVDESK